MPRFVRVCAPFARPPHCEDVCTNYEPTEATKASVHRFP